MTDAQPDPSLIDQVGEHSHQTRTSPLLVIVAVVLAVMCCVVAGLSIHFRARQQMTDNRNAQTSRCLGGILNAVFVEAGAPQPTAMQIRHIVQVDCAPLLNHP